MIAEAQFNRATLDCMTALRRQLKRTLGVTIRLGDPDAVESMIGLSRDSSSAEIRELGTRLADMIRPGQDDQTQSPLAQGAIEQQSTYSPNTNPCIRRPPTSAKSLQSANLIEPIIEPLIS